MQKCKFAKTDALFYKKHLVICTILRKPNMLIMLKLNHLYEKCLHKNRQGRFDCVEKYLHEKIPADHAICRVWVKLRGVAITDGASLNCQNSCFCSVKHNMAGLLSTEIIKENEG
jgi:hypothetical protein